VYSDIFMRRDLKVLLFTLIYLLKYLVHELNKHKEVKPFYKQALLKEADGQRIRVHGTEGYIELL